MKYNPAPSKKIMTKKSSRADFKTFSRLYLKSFEEIFPHLSGIELTEAFYALSGSEFKLTITIDDCVYRYRLDGDYYFQREIDLESGNIYNCVRVRDGHEPEYVNIKKEWVERIDK